MNLYRKKSINKYHNIKVIYDGIKFDSKRECNYYKKLKLLERAGEITELQRQVPFVLIPSYVINGKKIREVRYIADFIYITKEGNLKIVDVKSYITKKNSTYILKKKMFEYFYKIEIEEIL